MRFTKMAMLVLIVGMLISAGGCGILQDVHHIGERWKQNQQTNYIRQHPNTAPEIKNVIRNGSIIRGMTRAQVVASIGGPGSINRTVGSWGVHEQWVYSGFSMHPNTRRAYSYLYFENGILTSWQN